MSRTARRVILGACCLVALAFMTDMRAQVQAPKEGQAKFWTVAGYRHGPSAFKRTFSVETTPLQEGVLDFKHFHKYTETVEFLKKWAKQYPDLVDIYVVTQSFGGVDIYQVTVTNKKTGKDTDKPAMYIEGNRHSGEVTAGESALWMLNYMLTNYGKDKEVTRLLDNFTYYFRPVNNPDGNLLYLETAQTLRSTIRPHDDDGDGLLDEDPPEDLDGDGVIRQMRVKVEMGKGDAILDPRDPSGRLMKRVGAGKGDYLYFQTEGYDNDGDGRINEDGIGGVDLHRNYPENWRPETEETLRGFTQNGAGEYPLSEVETRAVVTFLLAHPNVSVVNTMDTSVPMLLRPPSTSPSEERMYPDDLALYKAFDAKGKQITGYARAGDVYNDYGGGSPLFGHSPDFGYWQYGAIWYGDELWNGGNVGDYNKDGIVNDELDRLMYNDKELKVSRFKPWTKVNHPDFGVAEVGGWDPKFWNQNPPPELLEIWAEKEARFNLMLAASLPEVVMTDPKITNQGDDYTIEVSVENQGVIPTALKQAQLVKIVRPDTVGMVFPAGMTSVSATGGRGGRGGRGGGGGDMAGMGGGGGGRSGRGAEGAQPAQPTASTDKVIIVEPQGRTAVTIDRLAGSEKKPVTFKIRLNGISGTECTLRYLSTRGGVVEKKIYIGKK